MFWTLIDWIEWVTGRYKCVYCMHYRHLITFGTIDKCRYMKCAKCFIIFHLSMNMYWVFFLLLIISRCALNTGTWNAIALEFIFYWEVKLMEHMCQIDSWFPIVLFEWWINISNEIEIIWVNTVIIVTIQRGHLRHHAEKSIYCSF